MTNWLFFFIYGAKHANQTCSDTNRRANLTPSPAKCSLPGSLTATTMAQNVNRDRHHSFLLHSHFLITQNGGVATNAGAAVVKRVLKRFEELLMVWNKAIEGKDAWYWTHLEPLLVHNIEMGLPEAVKEFLGDLVYEPCVAASFLSLEHPKLRTFLAQVCLPAIFSTEIMGTRFEEFPKEFWLFFCNIRSYNVFHNFYKFLKAVWN